MLYRPLGNTGIDVSALGFGSMRLPMVTIGGEEYVDIDMPGVEHGHSGGPILMLQDQVIAVAVQRRSGSVSDTIGATYAVPIKYVTALIDGGGDVAIATHDEVLVADALRELDERSVPHERYEFQMLLGVRPW